MLNGRPTEESTSRAKMLLGRLAIANPILENAIAFELDKAWLAGHETAMLVIAREKK